MKTAGKEATTRLCKKSAKEKNVKTENASEEIHEKENVKSCTENAALKILQNEDPHEEKRKTMLKQF